MTRIDLPHCHHGITQTITHAHRAFDCTFCFGPDGYIREVFMRAAKEGSDLDAFLSDSCIAISLLLQHGETLEAPSKAFGENRVEGAESDPPSSALGSIVRAGALLDRRALEVIR